jgi:HK97 family phage major capsid protein
MKRKFINLPKMGTRRFPGLCHPGATSYKSDELVALEKLNDAHETKFKAFQQELVEKGATIKQLMDEVQELRAKSGHMKITVPDNKMSMQALLLKEFEASAERVVKEYRNDTYTKQAPYTAFQTKAVGTMTTAGNITGVSISAVPTFDNQFATRGRQLVHMRDLIRTINTATGLYMYPRQNTPVGEGSVAATSQPGATKSKRDYDNTMATVNARYRAGTTDMAVEMEQDIPGIAQYVTEELTEDYLQTETFDFTETMVAAATGPTTVPAGVTVLAEKIPHWIANLEQRNYQATDIVVRPRLWATLLNTKPSDYGVPGGFVITPMGDIIFAGIRLVKCSTNAISDEQVLIGDFRKALIVQKSGEGFRVQMFNQHDQAVYNNIITFRGEARAEIAVRRPDAFLVGTA